VVADRYMWLRDGVRTATGVWIQRLSLIPAAPQTRGYSQPAGLEQSDTSQIGSLPLIVTFISRNKESVSKTILIVSVIAI